MNYARSIIQGYEDEGAKIEEIWIDRLDWLYYATYSDEGDAVWVLGRELR